MKRTANAQWNGDLTTGKGQLSTQSGVLDHTPYSFNTRFTDGIGTNPEELLGASHAGCFTMALTYALSKLGHVPGELNTKATVTMDPAKLEISLIELELTAQAIEGLSEAEFNQQALQAKEHCLISKALTGVKIRLTVNYHQ